MIKFNKLGNIIPGSTHLMTLIEFENNFVKELRPDETRKLIYTEFKNFIAYLKSYLNCAFYILADGSFVSKKKNPADIDFVCVLPPNVFEDKKIIDQMQAQLYTFRNKKGKMLDFYFIPDYSMILEQKLKKKYKKHYVYWTEHFSQTKPDELGEKHEKGFIKIIF